MKLIYLLSALLCVNLSVAQKIKTFNKGRVVQKNYNVSIPYQDLRGLAIVEAVIKGKSYNFIVDTGALTAISQELYDELGLNSQTEVNIKDSSNLQQNMKLTTLPDVNLGGVTFTDVPAVVAAGNNFFFECLGVDGFIGSNMMRNSIVKFSYKDKTVSFTDKLKNFSTDKKKSADLLKDKTQSNPHLWVNLNNNGIAGSETLLFDSGMVGLYDLSLAAYESTFQKANIFTVIHQAEGAYSLGIHGVENQKEHYMLLLPELNFSGVTLRNVTTTTTGDTRSRIGNEILKYGDVIVDYSRGKLYFNPYTEGAIDLTEKNWPVQPVIREDKFVVGIVWDSVLNDRINEGDEIIKFGEFDYSDVDACATLKLNLKPESDTAVMVLKDVKTGEIKEVTLVKK